jgi:hypothetical protein
LALYVFSNSISKVNFLPSPLPLPAGKGKARYNNTEADCSIHHNFV